MTLFDLTGRVAIVTGGNGGIGRGIALALAAAGADVVIAARNEQKTAAVVAEIQSAGRRAVGIVCDVCKQEQIDDAVAQTISALAPPDILVNNSGMAIVGKAETLSGDDWDAVMDTNLKSCFLFAKAVFPTMRERGGGKVINVASEYAIFGAAAVPSYAASKGGVVQLTKSQAIGWARYNIQANCLVPGWIRTDLTSEVSGDSRTSERIVERTPARRWGEPEDMGGAAVFLASKASDFVTGVSLLVDGGYAINGG